MYCVTIKVKTKSLLFYPPPPTKVCEEPCRICIGSSSVYCVGIIGQKNEAFQAGEVG